MGPSLNGETMKYYIVLISYLATQAFVAVADQPIQKKDGIPNSLLKDSIVIKETVRPGSGEALLVKKRKSKKSKQILSLTLPSGPFRDMQGCFNCHMDFHRGSLCCMCPYTSRLFKHPLAPAPIHPFPEVKTACMSLKRAYKCDGNIWFCPAKSPRTGKILHRLECNYCTEA